MGWQNFTIALGMVLALLSSGRGRADDSAPLAAPRAVGPWLRPATDVPAEPVWGIEGGLAVGLWPVSGPRGLIRVYAPFLGQPHPRMINYLSIEPVVRGVRGQSELEIGLRSQRTGLTFWTGDTLDTVADKPRDPTAPARGQIVPWGPSEALTFYLATEPFRNGAQPIVQVVLRQDRPREVGFRVYSARGSAPMGACVLSATMGNYARLRRLWLRDEVVDARDVWPHFQPDPLGFAPWRAWSRERFVRRGDDVLVAATSDEDDPARAEYASEVQDHWRYQGRPCTQYWRAPDASGAVVRVNGRTRYWRDGPIPGGVAYENFELEVPFTAGQEFWFGVTPEGPGALGFAREHRGTVAGGGAAASDRLPGLWLLILLVGMTLGGAILYRLFPRKGRT